MEALDFILKDTEKITVSYQVRLAWFLVLTVLPAAIALLWRRDFNGLDEISVWIASTAILLICSALPWWMQEDRIPSRQRQKMKRLFVFAAFATVLILSCLRPGMLFGTSYPTWDFFWAEAWACFEKGLATTLTVSLLSGFVVSRFYPVPSSGQRLGVCMLSGLSGVAMLNLHCASSHVGHIALAHWLPSILVIGCSFGILSFFFQKKVNYLLRNTRK